jgi:hypothetical protein
MGFVSFEEQYRESYNKYFALSFLLPEDVIRTSMEYYSFLSDLFENDNDAELGIKLLTTLNEKVFDVVNVIRNHIAIDDLSTETRKLMSAKPQFQFPKDSDSE